jgi:hypothetical protein
MRTQEPAQSEVGRRELRASGRAITWLYLGSWIWTSEKPQFGAARELSNSLGKQPSLKLSLDGQNRAALASALGARIIADMPSGHLSRSLRATLHEHSHLLPERVLADRGLDVSHRLHRLAVYL